MKRTFQPSNLVRKRRHGFRARMATVGGRNVIRRRRAKGRKRLSAQIKAFMTLITIKKRSEFIKSNKFSKKIYTPNFIIQKIETNKTDKIPYFGFTITKKIGSAIVRNKIKRRLKAIIKELLKCKDKYFDLSFNYVLICKKEIVKLSYNDLKNELKDEFKSNRVN